MRQKDAGRNARQSKVLTLAYAERQEDTGSNLGNLSSLSVSVSI